MKNLWKKLYFTAGLLVTISSIRDWLKTPNAKQMETEFKDSIREIGLLKESSVRTLWGFTVVLATLISWPLWVIQVIIDYTNK